MTDMFSIYELGLEKLLYQLDKNHPRRSEASTLQTRLLENIANTRLYGDAETNRAGRAQILEALNHLALATLGTDFAELCNEDEKRALQPDRIGSRVLRRFPGLAPFETEDADVFFGRDKDITRLALRIERDPIVIVNGPSGCGKSSLIRAGIIPCLKKSGYQTIYVPIHENVVDDILRIVGRRLVSRNEWSGDFVDALQQLQGDRPRPTIVLIVDQFERALRASHDPHALEEFIKGISRLVSAANRCATVVLVLRADWLYFLESFVHRSYSQLNIHSYMFTLHPLTREAAWNAITKPLENESITFESKVVESIVDGLQKSSIGPASDSYIHPIQLQIVLRTLFLLAEEKDSPQQALTEEIYRQTGGVESILRNHLTNSLGHRSESWRLLARFIAPGGKTGQTIRRSELLAVPAAEEVAQELRFLTNQGFIEAYEVEETGQTYCRLSHDFLVEEIVEYLNQNPDQQGWKLAEDWLSAGTLEWCESAQMQEGEDLLLDENRYLHIYAYRDKLRLAEESQHFLTLTALRYGHKGLAYWLNRCQDLESAVEIVTGRLLSVDSDVQGAARTALRDCARPSQEGVTRLGETERNSIRKELQGAMRSSAGPAERDAAARALWSLQEFDSTREHLQVGGVVFRHWVRDHSIQLTSYFLTALIVVMVFAGALYVHARLEGSWQTIHSLIAGPIPLVLADPNSPQTFYAVARGGPGPREGNSLFVKQADSWELLSHDFSKTQLTSMIVVPNHTDPTLFASLYGEGVMRSVDGGQTWDSVNSGLSSRGLTSLVADPNDTLTLFAATDDWRGVLKSSDGGESWAFFDYRGEIYGAQITRLVYSRANGGALVAGTEDGRILLHRRGSSDWELCFGLSKGFIKTLVVAKSDERILFAGTSRGIILRSKNGGESWEVLGQPAYQFNLTAMAVAPDDPMRVFASAYGNGGYTIWKSKDMGESWEMVPGIGLPRTHIHSLVVAGQETNQIIAGTASGLFISRDGGINWHKEALSAPLASIKTLALGAGSSTPVYAAVGGSIYVNGGSIYANPDQDHHEWTHGRGLQAEIVRTITVDRDDPQTAYAGVLLLGEWSVFITGDGGQTWGRTQPPLIEPVVPDTMALALAKTDDGSTIIYAGTVGCGVFRSADNGQSWNTFGRERCGENKGEMPIDVSFLAVDADNPDLVYASSGQQIHCSVDGGEEWRSYAPPIGSQIRGLVADPMTANTVYMIAGLDGFWRSVDGGETWQRLGPRWLENEELVALAAVPNQPDHLIVGSSTGGVWTSDNGGNSWHSIRGDLSIGHITVIVSSEALGDRILLGSLSDGMALFTPGRILSNGGGVTK